MHKIFFIIFSFIFSNIVIAQTINSSKGINNTKNNTTISKINNYQEIDGFYFNKPMSEDAMIKKGLTNNGPYSTENDGVILYMARPWRGDFNFLGLNDVNDFFIFYALKKGEQLLELDCKFIGEQTYNHLVTALYNKLDSPNNLKKDDKYISMDWGLNKNGEYQPLIKLKYNKFSGRGSLSWTSLNN